MHTSHGRRILRFLRERAEKEDAASALARQREERAKAEPTSARPTAQQICDELNRDKGFDLTPETLAGFVESLLDQLEMEGWREIELAWTALNKLGQPSEAMARCNVILVRQLKSPNRMWCYSARPTF